jgi:hypothetical protein
MTVSTSSDYFEVDGLTFGSQDVQILLDGMPVNCELADTDSRSVILSDPELDDKLKFGHVTIQFDNGQGLRKTIESPRAKCWCGSNAEWFLHNQMGSTSCSKHLLDSVMDIESSVRISKI